VYQLRTPAGELRPFIEHYWFVTSDDGPVDLRVDVFVDARADLVFNVGAPYVRQVIGGARTEHQHSNLDAQRLVPIRIIQRGAVRIAGVRFHLGGLGAFCRGALRAWTNQTPEPAAVFGPDAVALERDLSVGTIEAQAQHLDAFFLQRLILDEPHARFQRALAHLSAADGNTGVDDVAAAAGVSARHADRLFARYLGIAPKTVGRVLRFQRTLRSLMRDPGVPLADVAAQAGYFDHAHFIKDFRRMSGGVPRGWRGYYPADAPSDFAPNVVVFLQDGAAPRA
jgi:AraC-like DNA-binding protein